jgi:amino acid permease
MGKFGSMLIKIIIIINNLGLCIAYFRIFGEVVQTIVQAWVSPDSYWATNWHNYFYILMCSLVMIFFIFIKNISSLKKVAYLGVFAVLVFTISLSVLLFYKSAQYELESYPGWNFMVPNCSFYEAFHAIPTVFLAFLFQFNVFPIYLSLKHKNMETMMKATKVGVGYSLINFLIVGIVGFLLYGLDMEDTILNSLSDDMVANRYRSTFIKVLIIIICISFVTTCLTSFPILFLSLRENYVNSILFCFKNCCRKKDDEDKVKINQGVYEKKKRYKYISDKVLVIITIVLYFLIVAIAIVMPKLKLIFTIVGATAGTFIAFILPNLFYIRICKISGKSYNIVLPLIFLCLGIFFLIVSITVTFF